MEEQVGSGFRLRGVFSVMPTAFQDDGSLDLDGTALLDVHGGFDGVRVVRIEVLLPAAVEAARGRVDPLGDRCVRDLLDEDTDLHGVSLGERKVRDSTRFVDW